MIPPSESELRAALEAGLVAESNGLDFKRELAPGDRGTRALAVDLASFAVDGGTIVVGVTDERPPRPIPSNWRGYASASSRSLETRLTRRSGSSSARSQRANPAAAIW